MLILLRASLWRARLIRDVHLGRPRNETPIQYLLPQTGINKIQLTTARTTRNLHIVGATWAKAEGEAEVETQGEAGEIREEEEDVGARAGVEDVVTRVVGTGTKKSAVRNGGV